MKHRLSLRDIEIIVNDLDLQSYILRTFQDNPAVRFYFLTDLSITKRGVRKPSVRDIAARLDIKLPNQQAIEHFFHAIEYERFTKEDKQIIANFLGVDVWDIWVDDYPEYSFEGNLPAVDRTWVKHMERQREAVQ